MIDLSIKNLEKEFEKFSEYERRNFLASEYTITEKYDGTKLSILRTDHDFDEDDFEKCWIVSYKGNVMIESEFSNLDYRVIERESIGISQYKLVFEHLKRIHHKCGDVPKNTEFFVEFMMRKPTLTRDYNKLHRLRLIDWGQVSYEIDSPMHIKSELVGKEEGNYWKSLNIMRPRIIYQGPLFSVNDMIETYNQRVDVDDNKIFENIVNNLLDEKGELGGDVVEGVVLENKEGKLWKLIQDDQYYSDKRKQKKYRWKADRETEDEYFREIHQLADTIVGPTPYKKYNVRNLYQQLSNEIYLNNYKIDHPVKSDWQILDDLYLTAKNKVIKRSPGNNGGLFIGRFEPPTKKHIEIVEDMYQDFDHVIVGIVDKNKQIPFQTVKGMWQRIFPDIIIIKAKTGNLIRFINKSPKNINTVVCGADRFQSYSKQLKRNFDIDVVGYARDEDGVSATKVRKSIINNNQKMFKKNMDRRLFNYFAHLKQFLLDE